MDTVKLKLFIQSRHFLRGIIVISAAVVMHFTPDYIDEIIKILLVTYGVLDVSHANYLADVANQELK